MTLRTIDEIMNNRTDEWDGHAELAMKRRASAAYCGGVNVDPDPNGIKTAATIARLRGEIASLERRLQVNSSIVS